MAPFAAPAPDAPHPPRSTPASAQAPAAISANAVPPTASSPPLSPHAPPFVPRGRSKAERWKDDGSLPTSPSESLSSKSLAASYRDVLLAHCPPAGAPTAAGPVVTTMLDPPAPCSQPPTATQPPAPSRPKDDGWQLVESRKSRRRRLKAARVKRPVPADLAGRCFNCFSASHFAMQCRQRTRCFKCRALGHRSFACPGRRNGTADDRRNSFRMWRPIIHDKRLVHASSSHPRPSSPRRPATVDRGLDSRAEAGRFKNSVCRRKVSSSPVEANATCPQPSPSIGAATATGGVSPGTGAEVGQEVHSRRCRQPCKRRASVCARDGGQSGPAPDATCVQAPFVLFLIPLPLPPVLLTGQGG
jgi:hypothetical protein